VATNTWNAETYAKHAAFVPALAADLVDLLAPQPGEDILDLGCGDGVLTLEIVNRGARVLGVDRSSSMVEAAKSRGINARVGDAERLAFDGEFDAVFTNAVLHWTRDIDAVIAGVGRSLRRPGRFVGEFGGHGNVASIVNAARAALELRGLTLDASWYYPTADAFRTVLTRHGFDIDELRLFDRPTVLPTGITGWLATFGDPLLRGLSADARDEVVQEIETSLSTSNKNANGEWIADYVRLRFAART
jgi:trans-aconitate methyltransferase